MAYSEETIERRRCTALTKAGKPCSAWAMWSDPLKRCALHAGRRHKGLQTGGRPEQRAAYEPCTCAAYAWPHRPGGGLCDWPLPPRSTSPIPQGERSHLGEGRGTLKKRGLL
jgi:hypothetical protein